MLSKKAACFFIGFSYSSIWISVVPRMCATASGIQWNAYETLLIWEAAKSKELGPRHETGGVE
jgi:hypothetical protein